MSPLRIVIPMLHYYPDRPSGSTRLAYDEAVFLANLGHEVWIITQDLSRSKPEYDFRDSLHVLRYPAPQLGVLDPRRTRVHQERTRYLLSRYVGRQVDLVHGHSLLHYDGAMMLYGNRTRMCYSVHSPVRLEMQAGGRGAPLAERLRVAGAAHLAHNIEHQCLELSNCVTVFSDYTRSLLERLHGASFRRRVQVIPGWVDLQRFQVIADRRQAKLQLGWPTDVPVFFTLRRLVPRMGLDRLLHALEKVKRAGEQFHMVIGGSGPLRSQLERYVSELNLTERVSFTGFVPEAMLPLMYAAADAFVLPTAELECFGLIAIEALACGRPVLATPVGAIPEVLGRLERGWLAQDSSSDAIGYLLMSFLRGALPSHDSATLRATVAANYSQTHVLERLTATALDVPLGDVQICHDSAV